MNAGIIGAGKVSTRHIQAYKAAGVSVIAVSSRTREGALKKIEECGLEAVAYDDIHALLHRDDIDVVSICSPPEEHAWQTIAAARVGKHIAIEKPVAINRRELVDICEAVENAGVRTIVGFVLRWNDLMQHIQSRYIRLLGEVFYMETDYWHGSWHGKTHGIYEYGTRKHAIGAFLGGGCHAVDAARFLVGSDIVEVQARTPDEYDPQRTTVALVKFANGIIGKISATDTVFMPYWFNMQVFGTDGAIRCDNQAFLRSVSTGEIVTIPGTIPDSGAVWHHPFEGMIGEFVRCVKDDVETSCSIFDAVNTHLTCFAAEESARRDGTLIHVRSIL